MISKRILKAILAAFVLPFLVKAQGSAEGDVTIRSLPEGAQVTLSGAVTVSGVTPARFQQLLIGDYKLTLKKYGYETYTGRMVLDPTKRMEVDVKLSPKTRFKAGIRSLVIPGWGQKYTEQNTKGILFAALALGSAAAYLAADHRFDDKLEIYQNKLRRYDSLYYNGAIEDLRRLKPELDAAQNDAYDAENIRRIAIGMTVAVWTLNMIDVLFFFPEERATFTVKGLAIHPTADFKTLGVQVAKAF
jgi:hypothetical protein